jgi:hypothetical protein
MKIKHILVILIFILALIGYGERCEANDIKAFVKSCLASYNWPNPLCECAAEKADEQLTQNGFAFLIATMNEDEKKAKKLADKMDIMEKGDAGMFMINISQECALSSGN